MGLSALLLALQVPPLREVVEVRQVVLQVRVLAPDGSPVLGLGKDHFRVWVDGQEVVPATVEWVSGTVPASQAERPVQNPRWLVLLVQRDLQPARARGLIAFKSYAARAVEALPPQDQVALLVQDFRLHLYADFTQDHGRVSALLRTGLFRPPPPAAPGPLATLLPEAVQRQATSRERGLLLLARAMASLPGEKAMLLVGWGLGRFSHPSFFLPREYWEAVRLLADARVAVFSLDITQADWHTLELGLVQVAEDTGGLYAKTHLFPDQALRRLLGALAGFYEIAFPRPPLPEGVHSVEVELVGAKGLVFCRRTFADSPSPALP